MGQRSQIYVRYNKRDMNGVNYKKLIANYYQWNYGERMISRARWGIEFIKEYLSLGGIMDIIGLSSPEVMYIYQGFSMQILICTI